MRIQRRIDELCGLARNLAYRRHDRPIRRIQLRPLDLTTHDAKLVLKKKQLCLGVVDSQPYINPIQEQAEPGVRESEKHQRLES